MKMMENGQEGGRPCSTRGGSHSRQSVGTRRQGKRQGPLHQTVQTARGWDRAMEDATATGGSVCRVTPTIDDRMPLSQGRFRAVRARRCLSVLFPFV